MCATSYYFHSVYALQAVTLQPLQYPNDILVDTII
jgi:hypothetical protein